MTRWDTVAIVGVGLLGGSIGLALRERRLAKTVVGIGRRAASLRKARAAGAVSTTTTQLPRGVADAELVIVCTPVERIVEHSLAAAESCPANSLITDVGSTKAAIVAELDRELSRVEGARFVGSHPMAGGEKAGPEHARADLLEGRNVVVTPTRRTRTSDYESIVDFWRSLGANVVRKTPESHDRAVAAISHLPHLVASALAAATTTTDLELAASGWLDTTRVAAGDADLWRQILSDNRDNTLNSLSKLEEVLSQFRSALETDDERKLLRLLQAGQHIRQAANQ